ncbi:MAG: glutamyl-tRNA reductase [Phycisphaerae bacterium]
MTQSADSSPRLLVVGLNHRTAPLAVREAVAFSPSNLPEALAAFRQRFPHSEIVILSTCNRVELYLSRPVAGEPRFEHIAEHLAQIRTLEASELLGHLYHHEDRAMVEHLFQVASSLDSMVVGETQILAQVKQAYQAACDAQSVGPMLHGLFQRALAAAKAVHEQTELASGRISIASVAVDLSRSVFDTFEDKTVLCIGAGEMAQLMLKHLQGLGPKRIIVTNRSFDRAEALAATCGATAAPLDQLDDLLIAADIVLTGTGSPEPIITAARFKALLKPRRYRPVVMVDIAVPRDVEEAVGKLNNVYLYNVDDLQQIAATNMERRSGEIERSRTLLAEHVSAFLCWYAGRNMGPLVKALYHRSGVLAKAELAEYMGRHPELTEAQRHDLERLAHRLVHKLLHEPVSQMTAESQNAARPMLAVAVRKLFALGEDGETEPSQPPTPNPKP